MNWLLNLLDAGGFKKWITTSLVALLIAFNNKIGLNLDAATITSLVTALVAFLFAQLQADHNKQVVSALSNSMPVAPIPTKVENS